MTDDLQQQASNVSANTVLSEQQTLIRLCKERRMTTDEIADLTGLDPSTIRDYDATARTRLKRAQRTVNRHHRPEYLNDLSHAIARNIMPETIWNDALGISGDPNSKYTLSHQFIACRTPEPNTIPDDRALIEPLPMVIEVYRGDTSVVRFSASKKYSDRDHGTASFYTLGRNYHEDYFGTWLCGPRLNGYFPDVEYQMDTWVPVYADSPRQEEQLPNGTYSLLEGAVGEKIADADWIEVGEDVVSGFDADSDADGWSMGYRVADEPRDTVKTQ